MFAAATLKFGVMKTKLLAQVVEPNGSVPTNQPPALNIANMLTNAGV